MSHLASIFGLEGLELSASERSFIKDVDPWAFILFARNIDTPEQVKSLTTDIRNCAGRDCLIFVDQEGGRVQRLRPPHWFDYPSAATLSDNYVQDPHNTRRAIYLQYRLIAHDLRTLGITADCAPVLDIPLPEADPIISDRAFGNTPEQVIDLSHAVMAGLMAGGVAPVVKHIPGHGRALVDSHLALPRVGTGGNTLSMTDFLPFDAFADAPMAMTAHVVYDAIDSEHPVTHSSAAIQGLIRNEMKFDGLLMTDDLDMKALSGPLRDNTARAMNAGCDVALQCSGVMASMMEVAKEAGRLTGKALERAVMADLCAAEPDNMDAQSTREEFISLVPSLSNLS